METQVNQNKASEISKLGYRHGEDHIKNKNSYKAKKVQGETKGRENR